MIRDAKKLRLTANTSCGVITTTRFFGSVINEIMQKGHASVRGLKTKMVIEDVLNPGLNAIQEQMSDIAYAVEHENPNLLILCTEKTSIALQRSMPGLVGIYEPKQGHVLQRYDIYLDDTGYKVSFIAGKFISS